MTSQRILKPGTGNQRAPGFSGGELSRTKTASACALGGKEKEIEGKRKVRDLSGQFVAIDSKGSN